MASTKKAKPHHIPTLQDKALYAKLPLFENDIRDLKSLLSDRFGWTPRSFQIEAIRAQLLGSDAIVHAGTGSGKTAIAAGPHFHPKRKGFVTIFVSPLIALQEEQVCTFKKEFGLAALAVSSNHDGCSPLAVKNILHGGHNIIILSPEMLLSRTFVDEVLRKPMFASRILSVVVDEAHVISHWGAGFRKQYGELGKIRSFLRRGTPVVALSATLPCRVRRDVLSKLQFPKDGYISIDVGNDRPNVSLAVRAIHNPMNTFTDLRFIIPEAVQKPEDIPLTYLYADDILGGVEIEEYIEGLLPLALRRTGLVRPYTASMTPEYRTEVMDQFRKERVRILICTDAAGMGCNLPNIDLVVQWRLPKKLSTFVQRAGRAARAPGRTGLAVLLVEKSAYAKAVNGDTEGETDMKGKKKGTRRKGAVAAALGAKGEAKAHSVERGINQGGYDGTDDGVRSHEQPKLDLEAEDEGMSAFIQTETCRREVLREVFGNKKPEPLVECCDICCPQLLDRVHPAPPLPVQRQSAIRRGQPILGVKSILNAWRKEVHCRDFPGALFGSSGILKDETIDLLAGVGNIRSKTRLEQVLAGQWTWYDRYGDELLAVIQPVDIAKIPKKSARSGMTKKRAAPAQPSMPSSSVRDGDLGSLQSKRARVSPQTSPAAEASTSASKFLFTPETRDPHYPMMTYNMPMTPPTSTPTPALTMPMMPFSAPSHTALFQPMTPAFAPSSTNWAPYYAQPTATPVNRNASYTEIAFDIYCSLPYGTGLRVYCSIYQIRSRGNASAPLQRAAYLVNPVYRLPKTSPDPFVESLGPRTSHLKSLPVVHDGDPVVGTEVEDVEWDNPYLEPSATPDVLDEHIGIVLLGPHRTSYPHPPAIGVVRSVARTIPLSFSTQRDADTRLEQVLLVSSDIYRVGESASYAGFATAFLWAGDTRSAQLNIPTIVPTRPSDARAIAQTSRGDYATLPLSGMWKLATSRLLALTIVSYLWRC
ncbi:hypothetical protein AB1N83_008683 [Pleurotus pulmonarius]